MKGCLTGGVVVITAIIGVPLLIAMVTSDVLLVRIIGFAAIVLIGVLLFFRMLKPRMALRSAGKTAASGAMQPAKPSRKQARAAQKQAREEELRHAAKIHRQQNWRERALGHGALTGFEPEKLASVPIPTLEHMFGYPGAGAVTDGTPEAAAGRIRDGHENFARALASRGLLEKFAIYWSVHTPNDTGAGPDFDVAIGVDCLIISGRSVWFVDVKNFAQGGVTWMIEDNELIAVDDSDGGMVGEPRPMGDKGFSTLVDRFNKKFMAIGYKTRTHARVVMLPRNNGLGRLPGLTWPGGVPIVGLPSLLAELEKEPPFNPRAKNVDLVRAMLFTMLRGPDGSPPRPGQRRKSNVTSPVATQTASACPSCGEVLSPEATAAGFCFKCTSEVPK